MCVLGPGHLVTFAKLPFVDDWAESSSFLSSVQERPKALHSEPSSQRERLVPGPGGRLGSRLGVTRSRRPAAASALAHGSCPWHGLRDGHQLPHTPGWGAGLG